MLFFGFDSISVRYCTGEMTRKVLVLALLTVALAVYVLYDPTDYAALLAAKRVVVCGASSGIGEELAYTYSRYGAKLLITARRENLLKNVAQRCSELGAESVDYVALDLKNEAGTTKLIDKAVSVMGGIDVIVLNHALMLFKSLNFSSDVDLEKAREVFSINTLSYIFLVHKAMPYLEQSHGSIVVLSSFLGKFGIPYFALYSASKHALQGYFDSLRHELIVAKSNVSITTIVLGRVRTQTAYNQLANKTITNWLEPNTTAKVIVKAGVRKEQDFYYSYIEFSAMSYLRIWLPRLYGYLLRSYLDPPDN
ncbi:hydroxysteroid 11-beta-dehydrogenase 1-like protein [Oscarella lobularis]|uniref:hydroxysteroid 11-beta-dehydrogenase 1-like protein n=1 Tax=Oscarella lobularis TaxID=121494 RepID=UPI003313E918